MKTILILLDSLNRHFLTMYGGTEISTPNIEALAENGCIFDSHFTASAPCMPARRELMTGTLELRHRSWGPLEPFDNPLPKRLKEVNCRSMLITDHYHYFEHGGENYHVDFTGFEFIRGHECDNWKTHDVEQVELNQYSSTSDHHERALQTFKEEKDFPTAKTFTKAIEWAEENKNTKDFFLYIDEFDPHEPFTVPDSYLNKFDDSGYEGLRLEWPGYGKWMGSEQELRHIRNRYRAKVKFIDDMLGRFIEKLKQLNIYEDTTIIVTTDHGHYLGEHGLIGKPRCDMYNTLFNIPLVVKPAKSLGIQNTGTHITSLTSTPDVFATICDIHGIKIKEQMYGQSFLPIMIEKKLSTREYLLYGYYGSQLGYCDGKYTYLKSPCNKENQPLYYYSTCFSSLSGRTQKLRDLYKESKDKKIGNFIPETDFPVIKFSIKDSPLNGGLGYMSSDTLYDFKNDINQNHPIRDKELLQEYNDKMKTAMENERFPEEQFIRLGLNPNITKP